MKNPKMLSVGVLGLALLASCATGGSGAGRGWSLCGKQSGMKIVSLEISSDPIAQGQQISSWRVVVQADSDGECATTMQVQEQPSRVTVYQAGLLVPSRFERGHSATGYSLPL